MSGVSSAELLLLLVIGLIVLGPKRLPEIAHKIGGWVGQARRMTRVMKRQLDEELRAIELDSANKPPITPEKSAAAPTAHVTADKVTTLNPGDPAQADEPIADHVPRDDDAFSPLHEKEKV